jgi:hypothetical protein
MRADTDQFALVEHDDPVGIRIVPIRWATIRLVTPAVSFLSAARSDRSVL